MAGAIDHVLQWCATAPDAVMAASVGARWNTAVGPLKSNFVDGLTQLG
jgi:hypothetical protein